MGEVARQHRQDDEGSDHPVYRLLVETDAPYVPLDAAPQDALGVDGADKELEHKLPMAHTEQDAVCSP